MSGTYYEVIAIDGGQHKVLARYQSYAAAQEARDSYEHVYGVDNVFTRAKVAR